MLNFEIQKSDIISCCEWLNFEIQKSDIIPCCEWMNFEFVFPRYSRDVGTQRQEMEIFIRIYDFSFSHFQCKMEIFIRIYALSFISFSMQKQDEVGVNNKSPLFETLLSSALLSLSLLHFTYFQVVADKEITL